MANRHLARSIVLQTLFEWDFRGLSPKGVSLIVSRNCEEFAPGAEDVKFIGELAANVIKKKDEIDEIITKAAPDWPLDKISVIDRNVLRIGLYELLFADRDEVPAKVAINEAIELAKGFGGENSGRFINGVLGSVYKALGEPGKDAVSRRKDDKFNLPFEKMPIVKLGGAVVYAKHDGKIYLALVHDVFGHWTLSKGKIGDNPDIADESEEEGTIRELKEEIGINIKIKEKLDINEYVATHPEKGKMRKQVTYFLAEAKYGPLKLAESGGLDKAEWFPIEEISSLNFYEDMLPIITKAVKLLQKPAK